jgi:hypothetical protein
MLDGEGGKDGWEGESINEQRHKDKNEQTLFVGVGAHMGF